MDSTDYLKKLADDISREGGAVSMPRNGAGLVLTRFDGDDLPHPTAIRTSGEAFHSYLDTMVARNRKVCPDRSSAYSLFLVHLEEEMTVPAGNPEVIEVAAGHMAVHRAEAADPEAVPPGSYEWRAPRR